MSRLQRTGMGRCVGLGAVVFLAMAVAACGATSSTAEAPGGAVAEPSGGFPRTVSHAMGQAMIPREPQRVIVLDAGYVDAALALETRIIALPEYSGSGAALPRYLAEAGAGLAGDATFLGTVSVINLEQLAALRPDLIVSSASRHEDIYDELSMIAPTVFSKTSPTWKQNLELLATALGKEDQAKTLIKDYEARAVTVGDAIRAKVGDNPVVSVVRFTDDPVVRLYQSASYSGEVLDDAGLARPENQRSTEEAFVEISPELIPQVDAGHIFVSTFADEAGASTQMRQKFQSNPLWAQLQGEIVEVSDTVWSTATGILGAHAILDDLARTFGVDPAR